MKEWSVLMRLLCIADTGSSADAKRLVIAVDEARTASLIAYFRIGWPVQTMREESKLMTLLFVCHCISEHHSFIIPLFRRK